LPGDEEDINHTALIENVKVKRQNVKVNVKASNVIGKIFHLQTS
jgi:hypothetical protein